MTSLTIPGRFNGPPTSANGGVTCGLLAQATGLSEVTLRVPPPLDTTMRLDGSSLYDGDQLVASAADASITAEPPQPVSIADARDATTRFGGHENHPFPTCFVCGPDHPTGLHLFPGAVADGVVATPWTPADHDPVMVWAALDCPSGWSVDIVGRPMVLGRMALRLDELPVPGDEHVVMGWQTGEDGRKVHTASALYTASGTVLAVAKQTWLILAT